MIKCYPLNLINDCKPACFLQTAYQQVFRNLLLVSYTTVCLYQFLKETCENATELPFNTLQNFMCCLTIYRLCSQIFFGWTKLRRKIALCSSELSLNTPWNFKRTFERTFVEKSREQRTKFAHFACITFAQYCSRWSSCFQTVVIQFFLQDSMSVWRAICSKITFRHITTHYDILRHMHMLKRHETGRNGSK